MATPLAAAYVPTVALAGNATITLESKYTGKHFTYRIKRCDNKEELYFVHLLRGADNEHDYSYVGCYYSDDKHFHPCKHYQQIPRRNWSISMQAIAYFFERLYDIPDNLLVYNEGKCARCGRKLTTPESVVSGFGPECVKLVKGAIAYDYT